MFINDEPIDGIHYRPDNLMTEEDMEDYSKILKASKVSSDPSLIRNERDLQVGLVIYHMSSMD